MINCAELKNFGPIKELDWQNLGKINLIIGNNGCGKSFLLKALYSAVKTIEEYKRGDNPESDTEILWKKLHWTFQAEKIGDLVNKKSDTALSFSLNFNDKLFNYSFGKDTKKSINLDNVVAPRADNSIYLPVKEVLSLFEIILGSRVNEQSFGFDDTYFDLAKALLGKQSNFRKMMANPQKTVNEIEESGYLKKIQELQEYAQKAREYQEYIQKFLNSDEYRRIMEIKNSEGFNGMMERSEKMKKIYNVDDYDGTNKTFDIVNKSQEESKENKREHYLEKSNLTTFQVCQKRLDNMLGGKIEYDKEKNRWYFKQGNQKFSVGVMAEGIKKIAILDTLLSNGYLSENSIVFIDEPEANLHPQAISQLLDIITILAKQGIQFFLASHSYFVIKKLFLIAQEQQMSIPVLSFQNNEWVQSDLKNDLPDNPIIDESIKLYEQQLDMD